MRDSVELKIDLILIISLMFKVISYAYRRIRELNIYNNIVLKPHQLCIPTDFLFLAILEFFLLNGEKKKKYRNEDNYYNM